MVFFHFLEFFALFWCELVGKILLHSPIAFHTPKEWNMSYLLHESWPNVKAFLLGGFVLGLPSSFASFFAVRSATAQWQQKH